jgi:hypothetical protein
MGAHRQALVDLVTDLDLDGLDVDYEINIVVMKTK